MVTTSRKIKMWLRGFVMLSMGAVFTVAFQNCGSDFVAKDGVLTSASTAASTAPPTEGIACDKAAFESSYHTFLKTNCSGCHTPGGPGAGAFGSPDNDVAFNAFVLATTAKINDRAVNPAHAPGITGPAKQAAITSAMDSWTKSDGACKNSTLPQTPVGPPTIATTDLQIDKTKTDQTLLWNLNTDAAPTSGGFGTATLSIRVQSTPTTTGTVLYLLSVPQVTTGAVAVHVKSINVRLNGVDQTLFTTFSRLDVTVPANTSKSNLSTATGEFEVTAPGATNDKLSLTFGALDHP